MEHHMMPAVPELLGTVSSASAVFDDSLRYLAVNELWRDAFRLGEAPLLGKCHYDVFPAVSDSWKALYQRCLEGETITRKAEPFAATEGRSDYVEWTIAPWRDEAGAVAGIIMHANVVTEREHTRRRLEEEEAFTRVMFESSTVGMNLCALDGRWIESNPAFLEIIGYSREEADGGLTYWELTPDEYNEEEADQLNRLETTGAYGPYDKEFIRKDGSRIPVRLNGFLVERNGEKFIWSLIENMTQQRALEKDLEQQQLKSIQAARLASIGEMAAGIAHEINNPLQIIEGLAFSLQRAVAAQQELPGDALDGIRNATERAARIVRGLLKYSREEQSDRGEHPAASIADESLVYTATRMRNHGVNLELEVRSQRSVWCGLLELTQVMVNLLNNAFDAVRDDRGAVRFEIDDDGEDVVFRVTDSGPGVPEDLRPRLFEPFTTSKPHGTGLGLSISMGIVEALGGRLSYHRSDGMSCFAVRLPAVSA